MVSRGLQGSVQYNIVYSNQYKKTCLQQKAEKKENLVFILLSADVHLD